MIPARPPRVIDDGWRFVLLLTAALTITRITVLFLSPLDLYPDEAQYWLWSRHLDFGYFSKPPVVAWTIWATTAMGGDAEPWIRLASPLYHAGATFAVFALARGLYGATTGLAAAGLYALMPGVQLSAAVMATDAPLLCFMGLTLLAYARLQAAEGRRRVWLGAGFGAALGLAFLSKYAAAYVVIGLILHLAASAGARRAWRPRTAAAALGACAAVTAPNLVWNAGHGFATLRHTAANAAWGGSQLFNPAELWDFVASQFGVFGPIPFAVLLGGAAVMAVRRRLTGADLMLLCFTLPPLLIVCIQAFISRANANWSGAAYLPGAVLAAAWLVRWGARRWLTAALVLQGAVAALFLVWVTLPATAEAMGMSNSFKRAKGWSELTRIVLARAELEPHLTAIAVNNRFLFNAIAYYGRRELAGPGAPPLTIWLLAEAPQNQAETTAPLTQAAGARVLAVALEQIYRDRMVAEFTRVSARQIDSVRLDEKRHRRAEMFIGEGFAPKPRLAPGE